jgi:hypothetical protein
MKVGWAINSAGKTVVCIYSAKEARILREIVANLKPGETYQFFEDDEKNNVSEEEVKMLLECLYKGLSP